ncbi:GEVED domain-containing protein [uncultured Thiothrix sp.]|uniref:GEVED domain-containing protein n=1 Tax=uncultured Thiothrix sp. TaxID=223185 RepID=UPI00260DCB4B|nr:GEVED domain-containing protein [uncultured Thiothrix sp.]HMT93548.1 GEVED domain-containing protein [Thiolinea sp.]
MKMIKPSKRLLLTFCAVGVLAAANSAWAADTSIVNCAQVSAMTENDSDSTVNNAVWSNPMVVGDAKEDDEACVALTVQSVYDLGDAPDSYGTLAASGGAQHEIIPGLKLGANIDEEADGQPDPTAALEGADDDGVNIPALTDGQALTLSVNATNTTAKPGTLVCWIDYNGDGTFATDGSESGAVAVPAGTLAAALDVAMPQVPATATADTKGSSYARCRLSTDGLTASNPKGVATDGEVEDYKVSFVAKPQFDLALTKKPKAGQATSVKAGDTVTYTIEVLNQGTVDAQAIVVTDYIPAGMSLDPTDTKWSVSGTTATTTIATLAAGATTTVDIKLIVASTTAAGDLLNAAEISSAQDDKGAVAIDIDSTPDTNPVNETGIVDDVTDNSGNDEDDHDVATVTVAPTVDLELTKTLDKATARHGDTVKYTLTVTNKGPDNASNVKVADVLPSGLTYVSDDSAGAFDTASGVWTVGALANGANKALVITATVK